MQNPEPIFDLAHLAHAELGATGAVKEMKNGIALTKHNIPLGGVSNIEG